MRSLVKALLLLLMVLSGASSFASFAPSTTYKYGGYSTINAYCSAQTPPAGKTNLNEGSYNYSNGSDDWYHCHMYTPPNQSIEYFADLLRTPPGSCGDNATNTSGSCDCNSGYVENDAHTACVPRAASPGSPHGATAPTGPSGPLGPAPIFLAGGLALGLLGLAAAPFTGGGSLVPTLLNLSSLASALISAPLVFGGPGSPGTVEGAFDQAGSPIVVRMEQSGTNSPGASGSTPVVALNQDGAFTPGGGGTYSGNGATGGWQENTGGATGEWIYTPPATPTQPTPPPIAAITNGGYTFAAQTNTAAGVVSGTVVGTRYTDGTTLVTQGIRVPVVTSGGTATTADIAASTAYRPDGTRIAGSTSATVAPTLGNGQSSGDGFTVVGGALSGSGGAPCGGASPCTITGEVTIKGGVSIREDGMPTNWLADKFKSLADAWKGQGEAQLGTVAGNADKGFFVGWKDMFNAPAIAACTPYALPRDMGEINPCPVVEGVRSIMALLWSLGGLLLCIKMVREVV